MRNPKECVYLLFTGEDAGRFTPDKLVGEDMRTGEPGRDVGEVFVEAGIFGEGHFVAVRHTEGEPPFFAEAVVHRDTVIPFPEDLYVRCPFDGRFSEPGAIMSDNGEGWSVDADAWVFRPTQNRMRHLHEVPGNNGFRLVVPWSGATGPRIVVAVGWELGHLVIRSLHEGYDKQRRIVPLVTHARITVASAEGEMTASKPSPTLVWSSGKRVRKKKQGGKG